jgi:hypothetical protein
MEASEMRYHVEWVPSEDFEALADKRGRPSRDESPWDYCEPDSVTKILATEAFSHAVEVAKAKLASDFFGQVRIERVVLIKSRHAPARWEADAVWHLADAEDVMDEEAPEYRPELFLLDDECMA